MIHRTLILIVAVCSALGLSLLSTASVSAAPGNSAAAKACQDGGYLSYQRSDGSAFIDEGACVSYAARGGSLQAKPVGSLVYELGVCTGGGSGVHCEPFRLEGSNLLPGAQVVLVQDGIRRNVWGTVAPDGTFLRTGQIACVQGSVAYYTSTAADGSAVTSNTETCTPIA